MGITTDLPISFCIVCILIAFGYAYFLYYKEKLIRDAARHKRIANTMNKNKSSE